jgi:hypothetical protein
MAEHRFAHFAASDPNPASNHDLAWWDQRVYFNGQPHRRRELVATLASTPGMTEKAARLLLGTAQLVGGGASLPPPWFADKVADKGDKGDKGGKGGKGGKDLDPDGKWVTMGHCHCHINAKGDVEVGGPPHLRKGTKSDQKSRSEQIGEKIGEHIGSAAHAVVSGVGKAAHHIGGAISKMWAAYKDHKQAQKELADAKDSSDKKAAATKEANKAAAVKLQASLGTAKPSGDAGKHAVVAHLVHAMMNDRSLVQSMRGAHNSKELMGALNKYRIHAGGDGKVGKITRNHESDPHAVMKHLIAAALANPKMQSQLGRAAKASGGFTKALKQHGVSFKPKAKANFAADASKGDKAEQHYHMMVHGQHATSGSDQPDSKDTEQPAAPQGDPHDVVRHLAAAMDDSEHLRTHMRHAMKRNPELKDALNKYHAKPSGKLRPGKDADPHKVVKHLVRAMGRSSDLLHHVGKAQAKNPALKDSLDRYHIHKNGDVRPANFGAAEFGDAVPVGQAVVNFDRPGLVLQEVSQGVHRWVREGGTTGTGGGGPGEQHEKHPETGEDANEAAKSLHGQLLKNPEIAKLVNAKPKFFGLIANPFAGMPAANVWTKGVEDKVCTQLAKAVGFADKPKLATESEMDDLAKKGWVNSYRAVGSASHHDQFRSKDLWSGTGLHGSGTYTAYTDPKGKFKDDAATKDATGMYGPHVARFMLPPDAKTVTEDDIEAEKQKDKAQLNDALSAGKITWNQHKNINKLIEDNGRYATIKGYDAITRPDKGYMVILNRSKTVAKETNE